METTLCYLCKKNEGKNIYANKEKGYKICHVCSSKEYQKRKVYIRNWHIANRDRVRKYRIKYNNTKRKNELNRFRDSVRGIVGRAIKTNKIQKKPCLVCGNSKSQAHHDDYNKPLEIKWFCPIHHREYEEKNHLRKKKYE
jgi:hypothetical protein